MQDPTYASPVLGTLVTLGNLAVWLGLASAVLCAVLYWVAMIRAMRAQRAVPEAAPAVKKKGSPRSRPADPADPAGRAGTWARRFFYLTGTCVVVGTVCLMTLILRQEYSVAYVHKNSNSLLPFGYRFASMWSDQEGTFFVWGLYNTILGSVLLWKSRQDERWVMPFFSLVNISLFTLLTFMNPFWPQPAAEVRTGLEGAGAPAEALGFLPTTFWQHVQYYFGWGRYLNMVDGSGLNESLQNPWMVIHPPTLFVGYSGLMIPSCFALGALMRRDYDTWVTRAAPWLAFSWGVLGVGIFLGAYWAYETLGWGGYWSWDPVENSSIIPWVVGTTLVHGLLAQRSRGNYKQANLFLGITLGASVLLGSFLVRSGVLGETSVHAFASPQKSVFATLLGALILWVVMSTGIWLWRFKDIQSEIAYEHAWERHFGFFFGLIALTAVAIVITFGVFFVPVLLPLVMSRKFNVDFTFYNQALLPVMYVIVLLMALTPLMPWRRAREAPRPLGRFNTGALAAAALITIFFLFAAVYAFLGRFRTQNDPAYVAFGLILALALVTNSLCLSRARRGGLINLGPWLAHCGFLVMLGGVVISSRFNTTLPVSGKGVGESQRWMGRDFTFMGMQQPTHPMDRQRMWIRMRHGAETYDFRPPFFLSQTAKQADQPIGWPHIKHEWFNSVAGDIYVAPGGFQHKPLATFPALKQGQAAAADLEKAGAGRQGKATLTFHELDMSGVQRAIQSGNPRDAVAYANVTLKIEDRELTLKPGARLQFNEGLKLDPIPLRVEDPAGPFVLYFADSNLKPGSVTGDFVLATELAHFQLLHVPGIQVLWFGCYIMFAGMLICFRRRSQLARRDPPAGPRRRPAPAEVPDPAPIPETERAPELVGARRAVRKAAQEGPAPS